MMRFKIILALSVLISVWVDAVKAAEMKNTIGYVFASAGGESVTSLGDIRVGRDNIEIGTVPRGFVLANIVRSGSRFYVGMGLAYSLGDRTPGFYAPVGLEWKIIRILDFRFELGAVGYYKGYVHGQGLIGANLVL